MDILVNNTIKDLTIIDPTSGCEWTQDLIGNADGFDDYNDERGMYTMSLDNYNWWSNYINIEQNLQDRIQTIRDELDNDAREQFEQELADTGDSDYEVMQSNVTNVVESYI